MLMIIQLKGVMNEQSTGSGDHLCYGEDHRFIRNIVRLRPKTEPDIFELECGLMLNVMAALPNIGGALCSTPQSLANVLY